MENQHRLISGYRELSAEEIALMNEIKAVGEALGKLQKSIRDRLANELPIAVMGGANDEHLNTLSDALGAAETAKTYLQTGMMWLTRAVAQPKGF